MCRLYVPPSNCLLLLFTLITTVAWSQVTVSGRVTSAEDGLGLPGVNVVQKGTTTGTVTDANGNYTMTADENATLVFSFVGYATREVPVGGRTTLDVTLEADIRALSEVVVIGYGEVEARDATGAISSLKEEDFNRGIISSPEQLIQGRAPGVQITSASGEPGAGINIRIRGTASVRSGNNPLFVVDGVPLSGDDVTAGGSAGSMGSSSARNPLNFLNPDDIASMDILKDASATAIYGARGANGVVIITTKSGAGQGGRLDYSYNFGVSNITRKYDLLDRDGFLDAYASFNGADAAAAIDGGANTDWQDEVLRTALTHNHSLAFGGGDERGNYRLSLGFMDQEGIVRITTLKRYTARFNGSRKFINDRLTIATQLTLANTRDGGAPVTDNSGFEGDLLGAALKSNPTLPVRSPDGSFNQVSTNEPNPAAILAFSRDNTNTLRGLGNISAELEIVEHLTFKTVFGFDRALSSRKTAFSGDLLVTGITGMGRLYLNDIEIDNDLWENYFTYDRDFGDLNLNALLGYSYQSFSRGTRGMQFTDFRSTDLDVMINNYAAAEISTGINSSLTKDELQSFFGRVNVGIGDKYILTATLRADGSTKFGGNNKYGYFPSAAFKWRLGDEDFAPGVFSDLNLRVGYGVTGNQEIPHNLYVARQRYGDWNLDNSGTQTGGGFGNVAFENPDLKWESTGQFNVGLDFGFFSNRLRGTVDYYHKKTKDLLMQVTSAQPAAQPFVWRNLDASVVNSGIEIGLEADAMDQPGFSWTVIANAAFNHNEVQDFNGIINTGAIHGQGLSGAFAQRIAGGQPLFAWFVRDFAGYDEAGNAVYNGGDVQKFVGRSPIPEWNAGLTNTFRMGAWDLSIFFSGQFGHYVYNNTANAYFTAGALANGRNTTRDVVTSGEGRLNSPDVSTRFLEDGSFVRLQNVSIGHNFSLSNSFISSLRLFINGQNLFVITDYSGQDPEVNINKSIDNVPSLNIDYTSYPRARTFTVGLNASF